MDKKIILSSLACSLLLGTGVLQSEEEEVLHYAPLGAATEVRADLVSKKALADDDSGMTEAQKKKKKEEEKKKKKKEKEKSKEGKCKEGKCKKG